MPPRIDTCFSWEGSKRCRDTFGEVLDSFREVARQLFTVFCLCFMVSLQKDLLTVRVRLKLEVF